MFFCWLDTGNLVAGGSPGLGEGAQNPGGGQRQETQITDEGHTNAGPYGL